MVTRRRVVIAALLLFAVGLLWWATTQDADQSLEPREGRIDSAVEQVVPGDGDAALRQGQIGVDLEAGWTAVLAVDGREIPEDQLRRNDPLNQVFFTPGEGQEIEELDPGPHRASALIWRTASQTRNEGRTVNWEFRVS
jgi:hypothetical protein